MPIAPGLSINIYIYIASALLHSGYRRTAPELSYSGTGCMGGHTRPKRTPPVAGVPKRHLLYRYRPPPVLLMAQWHQAPAGRWRTSLCPAPPRRPPASLIAPPGGPLAMYGGADHEVAAAWRFSHARSPPLAEAATPPEVVAQYISTHFTII